MAGVTISSTGKSALHASRPPCRAHTRLNPFDFKCCAARALVASLGQVQYRT